jgi:O-antigen/teichoic acid export membrane protein
MYENHNHEMQRFKSNLIFAKKWIFTLSQFFSLQILIQALFFSSGILIIRIFDKKEYALYTVAVSVQIIVKTLSDLGIGDALMTTVGKVWQNPLETGKLINATLHLRRLFFSLSLIISAPVALFFLVKAGATLSYSIWIFIVIFLGQWSAIKLSIMGAIPRFHGHTTKLQILDLWICILRLLLLYIFSLIALNALVAIIIATITQIIQSFYTTRLARLNYNTNAKPDKSHVALLRPLIINQIPNSIFTCLQGQITIWIITLFGSSEKIADLGALSRIGAIFAILGPFVANILQPRFARLQNSAMLQTRYIQTSFTFLVGCLVVVFLSISHPSIFIFILGGKYANTSHSIVYMIIAVSIGQFYSIIWGLNAVKGWIQYLWGTIPITVATQFILVIFLDISTIKGAIFFSCIPLVPSLIYLYILGWKGISDLKKTEIAPAIAIHA